MSQPSDEELLLTARRFEVRRATHQHADGHILSREVIRHPGSVVIIPCVDEQHVCLIRNYRISVNQTLIELPAGTLEPRDEPPLECARRELIEETGYAATQWRELTAFYAAPGILDEKMYLFLAQNLTLGSPAREADEEIENLVVTWDEAIQMTRDGRIHDAKTIVGLYLGREALRA